MTDVDGIEPLPAWLWHGIHNIHVAFEEELLRRQGWNTGWHSENAKRRVVCHETGKLYPSILAAANELGVKQSSNIAYACRNGTMSRGFHWRFEGDEQLFARHKLNAKWHPVRVMPGGKEFENSQQAANFTGDSVSLVRWCLSHAHVTRRGFGYELVHERKGAA